jgi:hypothetical protein
VPSGAYTVSFEAFVYPTAFLTYSNTVGNPAADAADYPQLHDVWQLLAYMASDKIFTDSGDIESMTKFRPLRDEQMKLVQRRTIVQYTSERTSTIYNDLGQNQFPWTNQFGGF